MNVYLSDSTVAGSSTIGVTLGQFSSGNMNGISLSNADLSTQGTAQTSLTDINNAIAQVAALRGQSRRERKPPAERQQRHQQSGPEPDLGGKRVADVEKFARDNRVDLRAIELDVGSQASADAAIAKIVAEQGRLDVVMHNAGHMVFGPAEATEQLAELYDVNVLSTQRVNRAALPQLRKQGRGLLVWVSSSSSAGGTPPYLAPYFAAKAGMDALAVVYARELSRWGIETSIIVPGAFTGGTNHFAHSGKPADATRVAEYEAGPYAGFGEQIMKAFSAIVPADADAALRTPLSR